MDLDKALVAAILEEGAESFRKVRELGVTSYRLVGEGQVAFDFLQLYFERFKKLPTFGVISGETRIELQSPEAAAEFLAEAVNKRHLGKRIAEGVGEVSDLLNGGDQLGAFARLDKLLTDLQSEQIGIGTVESLFSIGPAVKAYYEKIERGERGIQTPWPSMNDATLGFWPEDLVLFAARLGIGKSWLAILLALCAWQAPQRKRVLFITTEMSKEAIGRRFYAAHTRTSYYELTHAKLSSFAKKKLFDEIDALMSAEGLYCIGGEFDFKVDSVTRAIEACKPEFVILDGVYLLRTQGKDRIERMANSFDEVKRIAKRYRVATAITTQLNREAKKNGEKGISIENVAMSDVGGWNADMAYGLDQTEEMKKDRRMRMKALKTREGMDKSFECRWDLDKMNFEELASDGGGGGDADERGLGNPEDAKDDLPF